MKRVYASFGISLLGTGSLIAEDTTRTKPLSFSGYLEAYYSYDFAQPNGHEKPSFVYSFNRHNEVNLNIGYLKASYEQERVRGNLAFMAGTYAQYNLASEQGLLKNVFEANAGVKLSPIRNLWIDAGVMPSHIGFESAVGKDCWNLTRSIMADNSPYYESGVRVSYTSTKERWYLALLYLNGWQRIQRVSGNETPAGGWQVTYKPNSKLTLNWSTFAGNDQADSLCKWRYFSNMYAIWQASERWGLIAGFDLGTQQVAKGSQRYQQWYTPIVNVRYILCKTLRIAARGEYYNDANGVMIATSTPHGFKTFGYSLNVDYVISDQAMFRIEGRGLHSEDATFAYGTRYNTDLYFLTGSLALSF